VKIKDIERKGVLGEEFTARILIVGLYPPPSKKQEKRSLELESRPPIILPYTPTYGARHIS